MIDNRQEATISRKRIKVLVGRRCHHYPIHIRGTICSSWCMYIGVGRYICTLGGHKLILIFIFFVIDYGWRWEDGGNEVKEKGDTVKYRELDPPSQLRPPLQNPA
eukprot:scaffold4997_cov145-Skeletonema_menzelii.AAC.2